MTKYETETLKDIHWFTFLDNFTDMKVVTIWQAIGYIMEQNPKLSEDLEKYRQDFNAIECGVAAHFLRDTYSHDDPAILLVDGKPISIRKHVTNNFSINKEKLVGDFEIIIADLLQVDDDISLDIDQGICRTLMESTLQYLLIYNTIKNESDKSNIVKYLYQLNHERREFLQDHPTAELLYKVTAVPLTGD